MLVNNAKRTITSALYEILQIIVFGSLLIEGMLSIKLDFTDNSINVNLLTGAVGLVFYAMGSLGIALNRRDLTNANKIVLDLNHKIIFYEKERK